MIRVKILRGLDLSTDDTAELYLTLLLDGLSKTSKLTGKEKPKLPDDTVLPSSSPPPTDAGANASPPGLVKRESSFRMKELGWVWDEELDLLVPSREKKEHAEIEVCCFDAQFKPRGKVKIPLARLAPNESVQQWYSLVDTTNPKAAVLLKLTYIPEIPQAGTPTAAGSVAIDPRAQSFTPSPAISTPTAPSATTSTASSQTTTTQPSDRRGSTELPYSPPPMPMGIADYFIVAGCSQETARQDRLKLLAKPRRKPIAFASNAPVDELSQASVVGPDAVTLSPVMLDRYPLKDRTDFEFPVKPEMFLLPDGAEIVRTIPKSAIKPRFYTVVLVSNDIKTYGYCLEVFEPLRKLNEVTDFEDLYAPVVLCYLTRLPLPYADFHWILEKTYEARRRNWLERVVQTVVKSIPVPLPGLFEVSFDLLTTERRKIRLPGPSDLPPLVFPGLCRHAFEWFPLDSMIDLWIAALTEQKFLIHSHNREALAMVSETIVQLMYPFKWENAYVPVLPTSLMQLFDAPIPCMLGLRTDAMRLIPGGVEALADHWILIDADKCVVSFPKHEPLPALPVELRARLYRTIRAALIDRKLSDSKKDRLIRLAFLECLASMLQGYRESFFVLSTDTDASTVFNRSQFFQRQSAQKLQQQAQITTLFQLPNQHQMGDGGRDFLDRFFDTTTFESFKVKQYDAETDFFHAVYAARRGRERERDQRAAALAALQGEAESSSQTAASGVSTSTTSASSAQPQALSSSSAAGPMSSTTVVKIWNARDSRWNPTGLEPIDPAVLSGSHPTSAGVVAQNATSGRSAAISSSVSRSNTTRGVIHVDTPLRIGEEVDCKPFGRAVIADVVKSASTVVVVVDLLWGAKGYFRSDTIHRVVRPNVSLGTTTPNITVGSGVDSGPTSTNPTTAEKDDAENKKSEEDSTSSPMEEEKDRLPILVRTNHENFDPEDIGISLVSEEFTAAYNAVDAESMKKSIAQYRKALGLPSIQNEEKTAAAAAAGTGMKKSANDAKMERSMHRAIINVFQDKAVPENDLRECATNLSNSQFARNMLIYVLKSQQSTHSTAESSWLATPGRGRRLGPEAFASLCELFDSLLKACAIKEDFTNGRCALEVSQYYYCEDETLQNKLRGHTLWTKPMFWEYAFAEQFAIAQDGGKTAMPEPPSIASDSSAIESPSVALSRFQEIGNKCEPDQVEAHKQKLFEHLSFFLHTMLNLDVSEEMARVFVDRVANVYSLEEEQKSVLNMLITNISKATSYHNEEEKNQIVGQSDDFQSGSPNSNSKRYARKHYSVEAMTNTMVARISGWRRTSSVTKGKSPNSTSGGASGGRRDSQTSQETN